MMICVLNSDTQILNELSEHLHVLKESDPKMSSKLNIDIIYHKLESVYTEFGLKHFILRPRLTGEEILNLFDSMNDFATQIGRIKRTYEFNDYLRETEYFTGLVGNLNTVFESYTDNLHGYKFQQAQNLTLLSEDLFRQLIILYEQENDYSLLHWLRHSLLENKTNEERDEFVKMFNNDQNTAFKHSLEKFYSIYPLANSELEN